MHRVHALWRGVCERCVCIDMVCVRGVQIDKVMCAANIARAEASLQKDEQFQADMGVPAVQAAVDAVVADASLGPQLRPGPAQTCLLKLRQLREVLRANGGGGIYLQGLLAPWSAAVQQRIDRAHSASACRCVSNVRVCISAVRMWPPRIAAPLRVGALGCRPWLL
jgi:hypothetical protein